MILTFTVNGAPRLQTDTINRFERSKQRRAWREYVSYQARVAGHLPGTAPLNKASVEFVCYRSGVEPDPDNLRISCKPLLDGLQPRTVTLRRGKPVVGVGCGLIRADTAECIGAPVVRWIKCKRGDERVGITVRDDLECDTPSDSPANREGEGE